jgi:predicted RNase H-like HicB family nuclease
MDLRREAEKLAARPYIVQVVKDLTTSGDLVYIAFTPELEGCMGQGISTQAAVLDLAAARIDYILSLLEDGLLVPAPKSYPTFTTSGTSTNYTNSSIASKQATFKLSKPDQSAPMVTHLVGASLNGPNNLA